MSRAPKLVCVSRAPSAIDNGCVIGKYERDTSVAVHARRYST